LIGGFARKEILRNDRFEVAPQTCELGGGGARIIGRKGFAQTADLLDELLIVRGAIEQPPKFRFLSLVGETRVANRFLLIFRFAKNIQERP
jgi:hypothetical protein